METTKARKREGAVAVAWTDLLVRAVILSKVRACRAGFGQSNHTKDTTEHLYMANS